MLALGLLQPLGQADLWFNRLTMSLANWRPGLVLSGSIAALLYVYAIRFLAVSHSSLDAAMRKRGDTMLDAGRAHLFDAPHLTVFPGLAIALLVLGFNFLGDGLRDRVDPKMVR